jgi:hypothetical protein
MYRYPRPMPVNHLGFQQLGFGRLQRGLSIADTLHSESIRPNPISTTIVSAHSRMAEISLTFYPPAVGIDASFSSRQ